MLTWCIVSIWMAVGWGEVGWGEVGWVEVALKADFSLKDTIFSKESADT